MTTEYTKTKFINIVITNLIKTGNFDPVIGKDKKYLISQQMSYFIKQDKSIHSIVELLDCDLESSEKISNHIKNNLLWTESLKNVKSSTLTEILVFSDLPDQSIVNTIENIYRTSKSIGKKIEFIVVNLSTEKTIKLGSDLQINLIESILINSFINSKLGNTQLQNIDDILKERNTGLDLTMVTKHSYGTYTLIGINLLVWIIGVLGLNGLIFLYGAQYSPLIRKGEVWRLFTAMFIHASLLHILGNMLGLYIIGKIIEHTFGTKKFLSIYILGGLLGSFASFALNSVPSIGASGAVMAAGGALIYIWLRVPNAFRNSRKNFIRLIIFILYELYMGFFSSGIDNAAHIGGIIGGLIVSSIVFLDCEIPYSNNKRRYICVGIYTVISLILLLSATFIFPQ